MSDLALELFGPDGLEYGHFADAYFRHGSDTVIYMHVGADDLDRLRREGSPGTLIITGHSPADSIGIDAYVQELRRRGLEVVTFSGVNTA